MPSLGLKQIVLSYKQWLCVFHTLGDWATLSFLHANEFTDKDGTIVPPDRPLTTEEKAAVDYLCGEWDYEFRRVHEQSSQP